MSTKARPRRRQRERASDNPLEVLAGIVSDRRLALDLMQADLAALAGVGVAAVNKLENGQQTLLPVALRVLDALGLAVAVAPPLALPREATLPSAAQRS